MGEVLREMADRVINRQELARQLRLPPRTVRRLVENYREWLSAPQSGRFTSLDLARLQIAARMSLAGRPRSAILDALATTRPTDENGKTVLASSVPTERRARPGASAQAGRPAAISGDAAGPARGPKAARDLGAATLPAAEETSQTAARDGAGRDDEASAPAVQGDSEVAAASALPEPLANEIGKLRDVILQNAERERQDRDRVLMALVRTQQEVSHLRSELGTVKSRRDRKRGGVMRRLLG